MTTATPARCALLLLWLGACSGAGGAGAGQQTTGEGPPRAEREAAPTHPPGADPAPTAFGEGVVTLGMCPDEAIHAAGSPGPYKVTRDPKWPPGTFPPDIVAAQCERPDDSVIELLFRNSSQFATAEPVVFRVKFVRGKAVSIDRVPAGNRAGAN